MVKTMVSFADECDDRSILCLLLVKCSEEDEIKASLFVMVMVITELRYRHLLNAVLLSIPHCLF